MIDKERLEKAFKEIIIALGDNPEREGLLDTPKRAAEMFLEQFDGMNYTNDQIAELLNKSFDEDTLSLSNNLVIMKDIDIFYHLYWLVDFDKSNPSTRGGLYEKRTIP